MAISFNNLVILKFRFIFVCCFTPIQAQAFKLGRMRVNSIFKV